MKKLFVSSFVIALLVILTGCPKRDITEGKVLDRDATDSLTILALDPIIQKNDILYINVSIAGSRNAQDINNLYNPTLSNNTSSIGYLVSPKGTIALPNVGEIEVAGKTKQVVTDMIFDKIRKYYEQNPIVTVRILNYRVYIQGEVSKPGAIEVPNEIISLPQAIALAGGFTVYAVKDRVQLIRDLGNGKKEIKYLDLRFGDLFDKDKDYYYLKQGDQIIVKATKEKFASSNQSTTRTVAYATSALTILITLFSLLR
jgi:polysaccharide biosynthesis/export protein